MPSSLSVVSRISSLPIIFALFATSLASPHSFLSQPTQTQTQTRLLPVEKSNFALDHYLASESRISQDRIFCNIGPTGACVPGTSSGLVIAGPGKANPDYFYTWVRDSALTFKCLADKLANEYDQSLQKYVEDFISAQVKLQQVTNPSGDLHEGGGLGEPKFQSDGSPFSKPWGRPQRDGPALRAITLITYSKWLISMGYNSTASNTVWPIIKNDLSYVAQYWNETGFDLWEEVNGSSFFTISAQHRALVEGSDLASLIGESCPACDSQAPQVLCFLQSFWDSSRGYILANINDYSGRSAKDSSTILASIHQFDPAAGCDALTFQPCSDVALANHKVVTDSFRSVYPINAGIPEGKAVSVGRYPEDIYYNGNPWYLSTSAAAEQLYDALYIWKKKKVIDVTKVSLEFFRDFYRNIQVGSYPHTTPEFRHIFNAVSLYADGYMEIVRTYAQTNGSLSEQFDKVTGKPLSAYDLTWSYVAFITATNRRSGIMPYSWGKSNTGGRITGIPSVCDAKPERGIYEAAPTPTWPENQIPPYLNPTPPSKPSSPDTVISCTQSSEILVTFNELVTTSMGDTVKITGSDSRLGNWELEDAISLDASDYTPNFPIWRITIPMKPGITVDYKYIYFRSDGTVYWEEGPNHTLTVPKDCETVMSVTENWQFDN